MKKFIIIFSLITMALGSLLVVGNVKAADQPQGEALTVSPLIIEKHGDAGTTIPIEIKIRNDLKRPLLYKNYINDFETSDKGDEQGVPKLIFDDREPGTHSIRKFIQPVPDFTLDGQSSKTITFNAVIPAGTISGGYYGSIRFTAQPTDTSEQVNLTASIGNLTFIQVGGVDAKESMQVTEFYTSNTNFVKQWFFENGPIQFNETMKNDGNTFLRPTGRVEVYDIFNRKAAQFDINAPQKQGELPKYLLPDTVRKFNQRWNNFWLLGPYTAKMYVNYGNVSSTTIEKTATFWVIPWKLILLIIVLTILIVWLTRRGIKKYNKAIVNKDRRRTGR